MAYQYRFCPTCGTQRAALGYRCLVCGGAVRRSERSLAVASPTDPGVRVPYTSGWRRVTAEDLTLPPPERRAA